ncbi:hypothetical protein HK439_25675 [Labrenzia aggregata]|uniref:Transposase n=1 Tax=Roseibium aggregatum TaxID=187304 RepID=A0A926P4Z1_9HYPH|nr:hypothetical protein [Roseibium aggregatum]
MALAKAGHSVESLAREFEQCIATIHDWVKQVEIDGGTRDYDLTSADREELRRLRKENRQLRTKRDILLKGAAWFTANGVTFVFMTVNQAVYPIETMA